MLKTSTRARCTCILNFPSPAIMTN